VAWHSPAPPNCANDPAPLFLLRIFALEIAASDFVFAAGHRHRAPPKARRFQMLLRSRCTAMLAGLRTLIQTRHGQKCPQHRAGTHAHAEASLLERLERATFRISWPRSSRSARNSPASSSSCGNGWPRGEENGCSLRPRGRRPASLARKGARAGSAAASNRRHQGRHWRGR
jgi:hypothetical protein